MRPCKIPIEVLIAGQRHLPLWRPRPAAVPNEAGKIGETMALELLQRVLLALGPAELGACVIVGVPVYLLVSNLLDMAQEAWYRLWT